MGRVLIGCEFSGVVRRAFAALGHDAWSVDLLPSDDRSNKHIVGDLRDHLGDGWDMLMVCHPPCTRLCRSGRRWLSGPGHFTPPKKLPRGRTWQDMIDEFENGVDLFVQCWRAPIPLVAVENPPMHDLAAARMPADLPRPHIVQPWQFGDPAYKATGWFLRGLPPLEPTRILEQPEYGSDEWKRWSAVHRAPPGPDRWKERSRFFPGMAAAAAEQWGRLLGDPDAIAA
jgi:hypothetical protein